MKLVSQPKYNLAIAIALASIIGANCSVLPSLNITIVDSMHPAVDQTIKCAPPFDVVKIKATEITSPNYPNPYGSNLDCTVNIEFTGKKVAAKFFEFNVEDMDKEKLTDWLEVFDGDTADAELITRLYGNHPEEMRVDSTKDSMKIRFQTNSQKQYKGFRLGVYEKDVSSCAMPATADRAFKEKHVVLNDGNPNAKDAAEISCERNFNNPSDAQPKNSVFFSQSMTLNYYYDSIINNKNCQTLFPVAWVCTGVPKEFDRNDPQALEKCIKNVTPNCNKCNQPNAKEYEVMVAKSTGHLFFEDAYYIDSEEVRHKINLKEQC